MRTKHILFIDAILAISAGIGLLLIPEQFLTFFGCTAFINNGLLVLTRLFGAGLIGIGKTEWLMRNMDEKQNIAIMRGMLALDILAIIICLQAILSGTVNSLAWIVVIIFLFFAITRTYFGFIKFQNS